MYAFWSFAYNNVFDFLSAIYIPIISDQSKSNTLQKIKFSLSSWLSQIKKRKSLLYNSIVLICSEITSQKKIHLTIFFYLSIKKALEDFLHDNRDSSHKHTKRWGSTPHHLNCFIDFPHHRVIFQCWHASILFLSYQYVTWLKNIWAPILKLLPLHTIFLCQCEKVF